MGLGCFGMAAGWFADDLWGWFRMVLRWLLDGFEGVLGWVWYVLGWLLDGLGMMCGAGLGWFWDGFGWF